MSILKPETEEKQPILSCSLVILTAETVTISVNSLTGSFLYFAIFFLLYFHTSFYYLQNVFNLYPAMISIPLFRIISLSIPLRQISGIDESSSIRFIVTLSLILMIFFKELIETCRFFYHDTENLHFTYLSNYIDVGIIHFLLIFVFTFFSRLQMALN